MPNQKNINQFQSLSEKLAKTKSAVLTDYCGLTVNQITQLRKSIKTTGGEFKIAKNTLLKLALSKAWNIKKEDLNFNQPTAILFAYEDEIAPLKALYEFSQKQEMMKIKFGFLNQKLLSQDKIIELAKLPNKQTLQAKLVATLNSPISGFVYVLKANLNGLTRVINQIKQKKDGGEN